MNKMTRSIVRAKLERRNVREPVLSVSKGSKIYGGVHAIEGVDFDFTPARSMRWSARTAPANRRSARRSPGRSS